MSWLTYVFRFGEDRREKSQGNLREDDVTACCNQEKWKNKSCFPDLTTFQGSLSSHWKSNSRTLSVCTFFWNICYALVGVEQKIEHQTVKRRIANSIPREDTWLGCRPGLQPRECKRQPRIDISLPLFLLPFPSLLKYIKSLKNETYLISGKCTDHMYKTSWVFTSRTHCAFRPRPRSRTCDTLEVFFNPQMDPLCIVILGLGTNRNC